MVAMKKPKIKINLVYENEADEQIREKQHIWYSMLILLS